MHCLWALDHSTLEILLGIYLALRRLVLMCGPYAAGPTNPLEALIQRHSREHVRPYVVSELDRKTNLRLRVRLHEMLMKKTMARMAQGNDILREFLLEATIECVVDHFSQA
jgi:hypothetical protein